MTKKINAPRSKTPRKERNDLFESHAAWGRGLVIHQPQQISFLLRWEPVLIGLRDPQEEDRTTKAHQMYKLTLQELYNNVACDISLKRTCTGKEFQKYHLLRWTYN